MAFARIAEFPDFQAEYEGSIPFTRSNVLNNLACERFLLPTDRAEHFRQSFLRLFATLCATEAALYLDECRRSNPRAAFRDALQLCLALAGIVAVQVIAHRLR